MALGYLDALVAKENRDALDGDSRKQQLDGEGIAETMRVSVIHLCESKELPSRLCQLPTTAPRLLEPPQKKRVSVTRGMVSSAATTKLGKTRVANK